MGDLRSHLEQVRAERGVLNRAVVVDAARPEDSPLHCRFEWDDGVAAEQYRLNQAGELLRVHYRPDPTQPHDLRAYLAVRGKDSSQANYIPTEEALTDPMTRHLVLTTMEREWRQFKNRYEHMAEFAALLNREMREAG